MDKLRGEDKFLRQLWLGNIPEAFTEEQVMEELHMHGVRPYRMRLRKRQHGQDHKNTNNSKAQMQSRSSSRSRSSFGMNMTGCVRHPHVCIAGAGSARS